MLMYFIKKRHGSVTVFCSIILIAILSFSSLMVELGRMRSIEALFSEVVDNAAFSSLSNYDAALYKRFALMAINPNIDNDTYNNYLTMSMNRRNKDNKLIDMGGKLTTDATITSVYDLANEDVLKSQILELNKYRGVLDIANRHLEFEDTIKTMIQFFEKNIVFLEFFKKVTDQSEVVIAYFSSIAKYYKTTKDLKDKEGTYQSAVTAFNEARKEYKKVSGSSSATQEEKSVAQSNYDQKKLDLENAIDAVYQAIYDLIDAAEEYQVALDNMKGDLVSKVVSDEVAALDAGGGHYNSMTADEKGAYRDFLLEMDADIDTAKSFFGNLADKLQEESRKILKNYADEVKASKSLISVDKDYELVKLSLFESAVTSISQLCATLLEAIDLVVQLIADIIQSIKVFADFKEIIDIYTTLNLGCCMSYNNTITNAKNLPYKYIFDTSDVDYSTILEPDKKLVIDEYSSPLAEKVAKEVDYNLGYINPGANTDLSVLASGFEGILEDISEACNQIVKLSNFEVDSIKDALTVIMECIKTLVKCIVSVITQILELVIYIVSIPIDRICDYIYSHIMLANYAVGVFPNRITEIKDTNLLGDEWSGYLDGWAKYNDVYLSGYAMTSNTNFSKCRAEYIFAGTKSELTNQQIVYFVMLAQRFSASVPALLMNTPVRQALMKLCGTGLGVIIAVVLAVIYLYIEASMDMLLLTYGGQELPVIKVKPWIGVGGIKSFCESMAAIKSKKLSRATVADWAVQNFSDICTSASSSGTGVSNLNSDSSNDIYGVNASAQIQDFIDSEEQSEIKSINEVELEKDGDKDKTVDTTKKELVVLDKDYTPSKKVPQKKVNLEKKPNLDLDDKKPTQPDKPGKKPGFKAGKYLVRLIDAIMPRWDYTDYLTMYITFLPEYMVLGRMGNLIQLEMQQAYNKNFLLKEACTYVRVEGTVEYKPVLPIPVLLDIKPIKYKQIKYAGY